MVTLVMAAAIRASDVATIRMALGWQKPLTLSSDTAWWEVMAAGYEFFEHTADIGVRIRGATLPDLFKNAAAAMYAALGDLRKSGDNRQKPVELHAETLEDLLHDWLAELLFEVEANHVLYDVMEVEVVPGRLTAVLGGGVIDFDRSHTSQEIKAVTYHQLQVKRLADGTWDATVIFDV